MKEESGYKNNFFVIIWELFNVGRRGNERELYGVFLFFGLDFF